ncbi:MAG: Chromosome partition protein smc, partial [Labilithrix sp.]|nr:Chromosome partition protein smc [Labilithrix sp.]
PAAAPARSPSAAPATGASSGAPSATGAREVLPFIHDDWPAALAEAKRTHKPIFVDAWAPWCHSCLSMRSFVLTDPQLAPLAKDFVWLSIDTEKDENAAFVAEHANRVWPTLWVLDVSDAPSAGTRLRWEGTATAPELVTLLGSARSGAPGAATTVTFLAASRAAARGEGAAAEQGYRTVLGAKDASERPRAVEALAGLLAMREAFAECTDLVTKELASLPPGTSRLVTLTVGLSCAREAKRTDDLRALVAAAERAVADPDPRTLVDDRSALYEELVETRHEQKDEAGARATAQSWASFLEQAAAKAPDAAARAVFDPHRLNAYLAAGEPARAVPMLLQSERDFPADYNPPARLARAYLEMKRLDDAEAAFQRAATKVYGPRSLRIFLLGADIARARGDAAGERKALEQALARTDKAALNAGQKKLRADLEQRLAALRRL